jgi:DNA invertase Pin-like site-specific DNA recombinase
MTGSPAPAPERLKLAQDLFRDGASQREVHRTTGIARETLRKYFPNTGWTFIQGGEFRALLKRAEK